MKHLFMDLWFSIKKAPVLFLFIFIQIVITSVILYSVIADCLWTDEQSGKAQITWGDMEYLKFTQNMFAPYEKTRPITFSRANFSNGEGGGTNADYEVFENIDNLFKEIADDPDITVLINQSNWDIVLSKPKKWEPEDKNTGDFGLFRDETGNMQPFDLVHCFIVSSNYLDYFDIKLSEGKYFKSEDYLYEDECVPVLMGSIYKKYYTLGEEFDGELNYTKTKFKVVGFIAENQYLTTPNRQTTVLKYDNWIVVPYLEKDLEGCIESGRMNLFTSRFISSFFVCEQEKLESVGEKIDSLLVKYDLSDLYSTFRCRIEKELANNFKDRLVISITVCIAALVFSLFSFVFTMLYKINNNIKNYAVRMVVGETYGDISFRYLFESFVLFIAGQIIGLCVFKIYSAYTFLSEGFEYLQWNTIRLGIIMNLAFYIVTAVVLYICVNAKLRSYSIATLIRGSEVKKENQMPLYRVVIFFMLAIVGVFSMFIASYQVAVDRIDIYYTGYYTKNVKIAYVSALAQEDAPAVKISAEEIGGYVDNVIINRFISTKYKGDDYIKERGIYFNGYIDPVNMLEGRFFTKEETAGKDEIAVVGKEIYAKYVTFDDEGQPWYYCEDLDKDMHVIGIMGKEEQETNIDLIVLVPLKTANSKLGAQGTYTLDGKDKETVEKLEKAFVEHATETAMVNTLKYNPRLTVEAPTDILLLLLIVVVINATVFCFYYVSKQGHIHGIKKIIGYSKLMILADTFADFLLLTVGAFVTGNAIVILLKETIFKEVQLFSIYMLDPQVIIISLVAVVALTVLLSVIAIARTFTSGNTNEYRV